MIEFESFQKIARYKRTIIVTEKIDGTNGQICITPYTGEPDPNIIADSPDDGWEMRVGSRNRWLTLNSDGKAFDNFGFARWVSDNAYELSKLGQGRHFGEWWGQGIQRRYGLEEKRFSLFNTSRWTANANDEYRCMEVPVCHVVPMLWIGETINPDYALRNLAETGSRAAPGWDKPEGIVIFHSASRQYYKMTIGNDGGKHQEAA